MCRVMHTSSYESIISLFTFSASVYLFHWLPIVARGFAIDGNLTEVSVFIASCDLT